MFPLRLHMLFIVVLCAAALLASCDIPPITFNQAPIANAGADQTVDVGERVELNGLGSTDPDDDPLTYIWEQRFGPNVPLDNPNSAQASFLPAEDGFYEFALTVTDGRGGSDTSVVRVFVGDVDPETCPRADAGVDQTVNEGGAVTLRGCNSADPAGGPLDYEWFQAFGAQVSINGVFVCEPAFAAPQVTGADIELEFKLTVCNEQGCCDTDAVVITVRDRELPDKCKDVLCADDGLFCNGVESCDDGDCVSTGDRCGPDEVCDESTETCETEPECMVDADCDDALFCTGVETCVDGACLEGTNPCVAGQTCEELDVETYAEMALPSKMSFDPQGNLFVGSGGAGGDPGPIYKVSPGGIPVETYGAELIRDPDCVILDATGIVSEPGSVLVGGSGSVYAISPTPPHLVVEVLSGLTNINELALDSRGRLLMLDQDVGVYWSTGGPPVLLFSDTCNTMKVDSNDLIYTGGLDGIIRIHDADGNLIDDAFATGWEGYPYVEIGRGGAWGTDVYSIDSDSGELLRISASGTQTVVSNGFFLSGDLEFGPGDALYVSDRGNDRILRIAPACVSADCTPVTTRVIDGVTVEISTAGGFDMTARTYNTDECNAFWGDGGGPDNAPLNPENVSGTRFISSSGAGTGLGFSDTQPIIFEFDVPATLFGLTTLDLLENGPTCNPAGAHLALRAYDASGVIVDEHTRVGGQGPAGLDLDWVVSGNRIVKVELTGGGFGDCHGYGVDDLVLTASPPVDDLEDIGPDCTPVTTRVIDGVTVDISTAGGIDMTARTYNTDECNAFWGVGGEPNNAPLNPEHVSGTRFISAQEGGLGGFSGVQPIIFEFDAPVALFGLTTLDLLEDGPTCNPAGANLALRAYDASGVIVDEHTRVGGQGPAGLDLDWFVSGNQIAKVELTGGDFADCPGYGIDDLVLSASPPVDDLEDIGPEGAD